MASLGMGASCHDDGTILGRSTKQVIFMDKTTYFRGQNKLNRRANQVIFIGKITCFEKPRQEGVNAVVLKRNISSTEIESQYYSFSISVVLTFGSTSFFMPVCLPVVQFHEFPPGETRQATPLLGFSVFNPNRSLDRISPTSPLKRSSLASCPLLPASCSPACLDVARYTFGKPKNKPQAISGNLSKV